MSDCNKVEVKNTTTGKSVVVSSCSDETPEQEETTCETVFVKKSSVSSKSTTCGSTSTKTSSPSTSSKISAAPTVCETKCYALSDEQINAIESIIDGSLIEGIEIPNELTDLDTETTGVELDNAVEKLALIEDEADVTDKENVAGAIASASSIASPGDTYEFPLINSGVLWRLSWLNFKNSIKAHLDSFYATIASIPTLLTDLDTTVTGTQLNSIKTLTDFLTVTAPTDLDDIRARVDDLDAAVVLRGTWDASSGSFPGGGTAPAGSLYIINVAGTVDGVSFDIDDRIVSLIDNASTTTYAGNWFKRDYTDAVLAVAGLTGNVTAADLRTQLNVEDGADVTDTANVTAAGALMDSEVTNLAQVKAFDSADYATAAQGSTADSAIQPGDIDTLAEINSIISDATLIDTNDPRLSDDRDPNAHATTHNDGNSDELDVKALGGFSGTATEYLNGSGSFSTPPSGTSTPTGTVAAFAGSSAPSGWVLCDSSAISRATYSALFAVIGTTYGVGDGSTTFNVPDIRGRVIAGQESFPSRLTASGSGINGGTLGATGGNETHTLSIAEMPAHTHSSTTVVNVARAAGGAGAANGPFGSNTGSSGSGDAHNNVQPTIVLNYIIKT